MYPRRPNPLVRMYHYTSCANYSPSGSIITVASSQVLQDGWFATGDVGHIDEEGRLCITDRKKDLFKLSNGKYIAPQLLESLIKESEFVTQVVVVGAGRKQPSALIVQHRAP